MQVSFLTHGGGGISLSSHLSPSGFCYCLKGIFQSGVLPPSAFLGLVSALLPEVGRLWQSRRWSCWIIWGWNPRTVVKTYRGTNSRHYAATCINRRPEMTFKTFPLVGSACVCTTLEYFPLPSCSSVYDSLRHHFTITLNRCMSLRVLQFTHSMFRLVWSQRFCETILPLVILHGVRSHPDQTITINSEDKCHGCLLHPRTFPSTSQDPG